MGDWLAGVAAGVAVALLRARDDEWPSSWQPGAAAATINRITRQTCLAGNRKFSIAGYSLPSGFLC